MPEPICDSCGQELPAEDPREVETVEWLRELMQSAETNEARSMLDALGAEAGTASKKRNIASQRSGGTGLFG